MLGFPSAGSCHAPEATLNPWEVVVAAERPDGGRADQGDDEASAGAALEEMPARLWTVWRDSSN